MSKAADKLTPAMRQYRQIKAKHPNAVLFFRMGDFYEMFYEDAKVAARVLGIALTSRQNGVPMAGIPYHAVESYVNRMIRAGHRVAICDQLEDAKQAKGVVKRGVTQVFTAGSVTSEGLLEAKANNFIAAVYPNPAQTGVAWLDTTTGAFWVQEIAPAGLTDELARIAPAEILIPESNGSEPDSATASVRTARGGAVTPQAPWAFEEAAARRTLNEHFGTKSLSGFGCDGLRAGICAAGALLQYVRDTQRANLTHIGRLQQHASDSYLVLDRSTLRSLEIVETLSGEGTTLFDVMDRTHTGMGGRALRSWLLAPLRDVAAIERRLDAVGELIENRTLRDALDGALNGCSDIERLIARVATGRCNGRDLANLRDAVPRLETIRNTLSEAQAEDLIGTIAALDGLGEIYATLAVALVDSPPLTVREGGMIREGYTDELDELSAIATEGKDWIVRFQAEESTRTGIATLRVGFNKVFGYYVEIPHSQSNKVPDSYIRKQTVKNAERYITPELKEYEAKVLTAGEQARALEYKIFSDLREAVAAETLAIQRAARAAGELDALGSLAGIAAERGYTRPSIDDSTVLEIIDGRHPVLETTLVDEPFVPNDVRLGDTDNRIAIITGPNMAGKSTYIRQAALLVLLAQAGSFLPATRARIGVADRIFTRVGAADELSRGNSTFMVEMNETANILNNATERSLIVLDEVGRGTSTFDGLSIAWAITEYLYEKIRARTLFATHYHELTELALLFPGVKNYNISVKEWGDKILFLHKIVEGGTDKSYGIHVAKLAGIPETVVERSKQILTNLETNALDVNDRPKLAEGHPSGKRESARQMSLFAQIPHAIEKTLRDVDPDTVTPLEALQRLKELKEKLDS